ncbi:MAG: binding-protein-dependent transport system inner rane component [Chloroflexi bacterium]|nr:binding-protein-dependent transport system inner rane component [Chloroflexota bacterium]
MEIAERPPVSGTAHRGARRRNLSWWLGQMRAQPLASFGALLVVAWIVIAIFAPLIAPYSAIKGDFYNLQAAPSGQHLFGTDNHGRDILSRVILGSRSVMLLAGISTLVSLICGTIIALVSGYYGGAVDEVLMRIADAAMALPAVLLALLILAMIGPGDLGLFASTVIVFSPLVARVVRSAVLPLAGREFIAAAKLRGERGPSIMIRELLPNLLGVLAVEGSIRLGYAIFLIASLGFLGVGVQPPTPDWGVMVSEAQEYASVSPWMVIFPSLAIASLVIGVNLVSDGVKQLITAMEQRGQSDPESLVPAATTFPQTTPVGGEA